MAKKSEKGKEHSSVLNNVKRKLGGKVESAFEILDDVKKVKPEQWRNSSQVEKLTRNYLDKLGVSVPEERIKKFMDAYKDVTNNRSSVDEMIRKYGKNANEETKKAIKKYIPKSK